jgi:MHS family proline/betaine transporter-like MFS transporter
MVMPAAAAQQSTAQHQQAHEPLEGLRSFFTRPVLAGLAGNVMEWYDFMIYGYFAETLGRLFFPTADALASLIAVYGVFAVSFVVRPFGAALFGHIGDRLGRKRALELSVLLMAIPTFLLGLLPSYQTIGLAAPVLLTVLRILQGLSVGGEYTSSFSFVIEHAPKNRRGLHGALTTVGAILGILLASAVAVVTTRVAESEEARAMAWRLPFLLGVVVAAVGLWVRRSIAETPAFEQLKAEGNVAKNPLLEAVRTEWPRILRVIFVYCLGAAIFYILFFFVQAGLSQAGMAKHLALAATSIALCVLVFALPFAAYVSDRIGRRPVVMAGCLCTLVGIVPLYGLLMRGDFVTALGVQIVLTLFSAAVMGPIPAMITEMFPPRTRFSSLSLGYNASLALFGGTAPMIAAALIRRTGALESPAYYLAALAVISCAVAFFSRETFRDDIY